MMLFKFILLSLFIIQSFALNDNFISNNIKIIDSISNNLQYESKLELKPFKKLKLKTKTPQVDDLFNLYEKSKTAMKLMYMTNIYPYLDKKNCNFKNQINEAMHCFNENFNDCNDIDNLYSNMFQCHNDYNNTYINYISKNDDNDDIEHEYIKTVKNNPIVAVISVLFILGAIAIVYYICKIHKQIQSFNSRNRNEMVPLKSKVKRVKLEENKSISGEDVVTGV